MDAIIRAAAVSTVAFELRRPGERTAAAPAPAPAATAAVPRAAGKAAPAAPPTLPPAPPAPPAPAAPAAPAVTTGISLPSALAAAQGMPAAAGRLATPAAASQAAAQAVAQAAAQAEAALLETARMQEAARLQVQAELAELRAEAERRGYAAGREQGELDARRQLQWQVERVEGLAAQLAEARAGVLEAAEDGVVELAFAALCRILGEQAATREGVLAMVAQCAGNAHARDQAGVRLHPDDFALLGAAGAHPAHFSPDSSVALGGCIVDSATGSLDARLETQLARLAETLSSVRAARRDGGDAA